MLYTGMSACKGQPTIQYAITRYSITSSFLSMSLSGWNINKEFTIASECNCSHSPISIQIWAIKVQSSVVEGWTTKNCNGTIRLC
jgi:NO-binding membrane sensor protein with MHYT domain